MAELLELLSAYEIFRSHGFDLPSMLGLDINKLDKEGFSHDGNKNSIGNCTAKDKVVLGQLLERSVSRLSQNGKRYNSTEGPLDEQNNRSILPIDKGDIKVTEQAIMAKDDQIHAGEEEPEEHIEGSSLNPIRVSSLTSKIRSFKEVLTNKGEEIIAQEERTARPLKPLSTARFEGGNLVVDMDEDDYNMGVEELQYSVVGRLFLKKGSPVPTTMEIKAKLSASWGLENFKLIPMGGGLHHVTLHSMEEQSAVLAHGPINVSPGTFRIARWTPGFDPACLKTTTQVWVRFYSIPLEFRKGQNLLNIAAAIGTPLKIDPATINLYQGLYARVLIDIDISKRLPDRILASLKVEKKGINESFFVSVFYEQLPDFCSACMAIGHMEDDCKKVSPALQLQRREQPGVRPREKGRNTARPRMPVRVASARFREEECTVNIAHKVAVESSLPQCEELKDNPKSTEAVEKEKGEIDKQVSQNLEGAGEKVIARNNQVTDAIGTLVDNEECEPVRSTLRKVTCQEEIIAQKDSVSNKIQQQGSTNQIVDKGCPSSSNVQSRTACTDGQVQSKVRWEPVSKALSDIGSITRSGNRFDILQGDMTLEKFARLFPEDHDSAIRLAASQEKLRKEEEWERTKKRLELRMEADMHNRRTEKERSGESEKSKINSPTISKRWENLEEEDQEEEEQESLMKSVTKEVESTIVPETQIQTPSLDPEKIYWDENSEIFVHASGMCYDPEAKVYYTVIDQEGGDLRPLYYVQSGGDFMLAKKGKIGQSNKVVLEDKSWDRRAIYSVKFPNYKQGLLKIFKEKIIEGKK